MATESERIAEPGDEEEQCICHWLDCLNPKTDLEGFLTTLSVICMSCGLAIMCVGYVVPRDYVFDPSKPAREMEQIEIRYEKRSFYLDVCILVGMAFIAAGGLISSGVFMYHFVMGSGQVHWKEDRTDSNLIDGSQTEMVSYGTASDR